MREVGEIKNFAVHGTNHKVLREFDDLRDAVAYAKKYLRYDGRGHTVWTTALREPLFLVVNHSGEIRVIDIYRR